MRWLFSGRGHNVKAAREKNLRDPKSILTLLGSGGEHEKEVDITVEVLTF